MLTHLLVPCDLNVGVPISCLLTVGSTAFNQEKALVGAFSMIMETNAMDRSQLYLKYKNNLTISCWRCEVREEETAAATHTWHFPLVSREIRSVLKILSPPQPYCQGNRTILQLLGSPFHVNISSPSFIHHVSYNGPKKHVTQAASESNVSHPHCLKSP